MSKKFKFEFLRPVPRDMLLLSSTVASRYYKCCTDNGTSPGNYGYQYVRCEFFTAVTMKNGAFWDVTLCASCKNRRLVGIS
jgi:hypothetical protein